MAGPIGSRNVRARIERQVLTPDGQGGHVTTWALRGVEDICLEALTAREALQAASLNAVLASAATMNYRSDLSVTDRLRIGLRLLQVEAFQDPDGRKDDLRLLLSEVQS